MKVPLLTVSAAAIALLMLAGIAGASQLTVYSGSSTTGTPFNYADSTFAQQLVGSGTTMEPAGSGDAGMKTEPGATNVWYDTDRMCMIFDLPGLPKGATINSATIDVPGAAKYVTFAGVSPAWGISGYTPTIQGQVNIADFQTRGPTRLNTADIAYADLDQSGNYGHNVWMLNPAGKSSLTPGGKAAFMVRINWDLDSTNPGWQSGAFAYFHTTPVSGQFPKLTIDYTTGGSPPAAVPPVASFSGNATAGNAPLTVRFTETSAGTLASWSWSFGDGGTSALQNPVHVYQAAGTYTVTLTATNSGGSDSMTRPGYVTVSAPAALPVASFTATPTSGNAPLTVRFTDTSSAAPISWVWSFTNVTGNNTPVIFSTNQNPVQTFGAGNFAVGLNVANGYGSASTPAFLHWINASAPANSRSRYPVVFQHGNWRFHR